MIGILWVIGDDMYLQCPLESWKLTEIEDSGAYVWKPWGVSSAPIVHAKSYLAKQPLPDNLYSIWTGRKIRRFANAA